MTPTEYQIIIGFLSSGLLVGFIGHGLDLVTTRMRRR